MPKKYFFVNTILPAIIFSVHRIEKNYVRVWALTEAPTRSHSGGLIWLITHSRYSLFALWMLILQLPLRFIGVVLQSSQLTYCSQNSPLSPSASSASTQPLWPPCLYQACPWIDPRTLSLSVPMKFDDTSNTHIHTCPRCCTHAHRRTREGKVVGGSLLE